MRINIFLICILSFTGCSMMPAGKTFVHKYEVRSFTVNLADWQTIKQEYKKILAENTKDPESDRIIVFSPMGFCDPFRRIMWVTGKESDMPEFDILGHETWHFPEFETLGHETWHFQELGGLFFHGDAVLTP